MKKLSKEFIPEGWLYAGVDAYGTAYAFKHKPFIKQGHWYSSGDELLLGNDFDSSDWQNSLVSVED